jgi:hypothetical protein
MKGLASGGVLKKSRALLEAYLTRRKHEMAAGFK